jgi:hypothetical protein
MSTEQPQSSPIVNRFRQIVLWPVQLMPRDESIQIQSHWEKLTAPGADCVWQEVSESLKVLAMWVSERSNADDSD